MAKTKSNNKTKLTISAINDIVESEGLGYAIQDYLNADRIADPDLSEMWAKAAEQLNEITAYLEDNIFEDGDEIEEDDDEEEEEIY